MITFNKEKDMEEFLHGITKLEPEDFIALAQVLDIKMSIVNKETGEYSVRDAEEVLEDMIVVFRTLKHKERKIILKAVAKSGSNT